MTRRPVRLALTVVAATLLAAGCGTFDNTDVVADAGGATITTTRFEGFADQYFSRPDLFGTQAALDGRVDADQSRILLGVLVQQELFRGFLAEYGIDADAARQVYIATNLAEGPAQELTAEFRDLIADADSQFRGQVLAGVTGPSTDQLRAMYAADPASLGLICVRHIVVATEAEARDVLAELRDGADFAVLAAARSIDPSAADAGGAIASGDNQCIPIQTVRQGFDAGFTAGALAAREGVPSEPVESTFGWHIILHRPWAEVADSIRALLQPGDVGGYLFDGRLATADVRVDPRYGTWDPVAGSILPVG